MERDSHSKAMNGSSNIRDFVTIASLSTDLMTTGLNNSNSTSSQSVLAKIIWGDAKLAPIFFMVVFSFWTSALNVGLVVLVCCLCEHPFSADLWISIFLGLADSLGSGAQCIRWFIFSFLSEIQTDFKEDLCAELSLAVLR